MKDLAHYKSNEIAEALRELRRLDRGYDLLGMFDDCWPTTAGTASTWPEGEAYRTLRREVRRILEAIDTTNREGVADGK